MKTGEISDPFLMTVFDKKVVHLSHKANAPVTFKIEIDFIGDDYEVRELVRPLLPHSIG